MRGKRSKHHFSFNELASLGKNLVCHPLQNTVKSRWSTKYSLKISWISSRWQCPWKMGSVLNKESKADSGKQIFSLDRQWIWNLKKGPCRADTCSRTWSNRVSWGFDVLFDLVGCFFLPPPEYPVNYFISVRAIETFTVLLIPDVHLPHTQNEVNCNFIPIKGSKTSSEMHCCLN